MFSKTFFGIGPLLALAALGTALTPAPAHAAPVLVVMATPNPTGGDATFTFSGSGFFNSATSVYIYKGFPTFPNLVAIAQKEPFTGNLRPVTVRIHGNRGDVLSFIADDGFSSDPIPIHVYSNPVQVIYP